jgi:Flp pilus assembly protein TadG
MQTASLEREASDLLITIGGSIEKWILERARSNVEQASSANAGSIIRADDINKAFHAFLDERGGDIRRAFEHHTPLKAG